MNDNNVVVTDKNNSVVHLYNLNTGKRVWTFTGVKNPTGVTSDSSGFIYVAAVNPKEICIFSPGGKSVDMYITCLIFCIIWVACSVFLRTMHNNCEASMKIYFGIILRFS